MLPVGVEPCFRRLVVTTLGRPLEPPFAFSSIRTSSAALSSW